MVKLNRSNLIYVYDFQVIAGLFVLSLFFPLLFHLDAFILVTVVYQTGRKGLKYKFNANSILEELL
jgi:hypothetical protein